MRVSTWCMEGNHEIGDCQIGDAVWKAITKLEIGDVVWKAITTREDDGRRMEGKHKGG